MSLDGIPLVFAIAFSPFAWRLGTWREGSLWAAQAGPFSLLVGGLKPKKIRDEPFPDGEYTAEGKWVNPNVKN